MPFTSDSSMLATWGRIWESLGWWKSRGAAPHQAEIQSMITQCHSGSLRSISQAEMVRKIGWDLYDIVPQVGPIPNDVPKRPHSLQKNCIILKVTSYHWASTCSHTFWWGELRSSRKRGTAPAATTACKKTPAGDECSSKLTWVCWLVPLAILVNAHAASNCRLLTS